MKLRKKLRPIEEMLRTGEARLLPRDDRYAVTKDGCFYSRCAIGSSKNRYAKWRLNKPIMPSGKTNFYIRHTVGRGHTPHLHVLVAETFLGPRPDGQVVRHLNGDYLDNRLENLAYGSYADNSQDTDRHGRLLKGEKVWSSKLTKPLVQKIRELAESGKTQNEIAAQVGISRKHVNNIVMGRTWSWVEGYCGPIKTKSGKVGKSRNAKYTALDILHMRELKRSGLTNVEISKKFNCHANAVSKILLGKTVLAKEILSQA